MWPIDDRLNQMFKDDYQIMGYKNWDWVRDYKSKWNFIIITINNKFTNEYTGGIEMYFNNSCIFRVLKLYRIVIQTMVLRINLWKLYVLLSKYINMCITSMWTGHSQNCLYTLLRFNGHYISVLDNVCNGCSLYCIQWKWL